jgi:hypothetical protein
MNSAEGFVSRWSRRKRQAERQKKAGPAASGAAEAARLGDDAATAAPSDPDPDAPQVFDATSLPPIESIVLGTDIRSFLQSGVPVALMRAALRRAWVTDPAIRDFIGIAENQWDFNDPTAIPGFGPMRAGDDVPGLAQVLRGAEQSGEGSADTADCAVRVAQPAPASGHQPDIPPAGPVDHDETVASMKQPQRGAVDDGDADRNHSSPRRRPQGGALPE